VNRFRFRAPDQTLGIVETIVPLDPELLDLTDQVFIFRAQDLSCREKGRLVLFSAIGPVSGHQDDHAADLEEAIVIELESGLVDPASDASSGFEVAPGGFKQIIKIIVARSLPLELPRSLKPG
jgi:hypothetical protein